jgi:hypothetical protein
MNLRKSARSEDVLRRTHARYFKTVQELVQSALLSRAAELARECGDAIRD